MSALEGLQVVECGEHVLAPYCARLFADLGATVTKIEAPGGDATRRYGPFPNGVVDPDNSALFHFLNAGKQGLVADLDGDQDRELLHRLLAGADVLVEGLEPDPRRRWGLDFEALRSRHPHLVVVSLSAYGRAGPWARRAGSDLGAQAASAVPTVLGEAGREPLRLPCEQSDYQAALHGCAAALCALHERERSGLGQSIDIAAAQVLGYQAGGMYLVTAKVRPGWKRSGTLLKGGVYPTGFFACADGFVCIATQSPAQWEAFLRLMGEPDWAQAEHARDAIYLGQVDETPADAHFRTWLAGHARADLLQLAARERIILGVVNTPAELLASEQFQFREAWAELELGDSRVRVPKPGYRLSRTPVRGARRGPRLDGDGATIRAQAQAPSPAPRRRPSASGGGGALDGIRVLDFGWNWAGPMATQLLADMGAEVIRIETSKRQDMMRLLDWVSYFFCHNNRNKKSATINIATAEGARLVRELARSSDLVLDNFAAGVMARNGLGYADLSRDNPGIIVVSMSMAGQEGPQRGMRGFASIATAYAGLERLVGYADDGHTTGLIPFGLGDTSMAIQGVIGALAALRYRQRTGQGQFVDVSQIESAAATLAEPLLDFQLQGTATAPCGNRHRVFAPHGVYRCAGTDRWLALAVRDERQWRALCSVLEYAPWSGDPALARAATRHARQAEIDAVLAGWCAGQDRDAAVETLCAAGVPAAPVLELDERDEHPCFTERAFTIAHDGPGFDPCRIYATPWLFDRTPARLYRTTPRLGEHNAYVFGELLGLARQTIERLQAEGVLV